MQSVLTVTNLGHTYVNAGHAHEVFRELNFSVSAGELVAVQGESGCGKTTLLLACGAMQRPSVGTVMIGEQDVFASPAACRIPMRARKIGYLFQTLELVPYLDLLDNLRIVQGVATETAHDWLEKVGLEDRAHHKPDALSHGQRQRGALARAMVHRPDLVIADEPTGNLDSKNRRMVFEMLREFANDGGAVLVATHDSLIDNLADRIWKLQSGHLQPVEVAT